jgi:hypothetical protein
MRAMTYLSKYVLFVVYMFLMSNLHAQLCPSGLISYWRMDETSGQTLFDDAGGHHATSNVTLAVDENAEVGTAHFFYADSPNSGSKAVIASNPDFDLPVNPGFSIVYWIKCTDVNYDGKDHVIISRGDYQDGQPEGTFWSSGVNIYGKVNFLLQDSEGNRKDLESPLSYNDGNWHQVAFVRNDSTEINYLYIDANLVAQENMTYSGSFSSSEDIQIGNLKNTVSGKLSYGYFFRGSVDEMSIYRRPLTSAEIISQALRANSGMGICDGLNPNIASIPRITAETGSQYTYRVHAGGLQTGMSYSLLHHPEGMTIDAGTGLISWTPDSVLADGLVSVVADNGIAPADTQTFRIYIAEPAVCPEGLFVLLKLDETSGPVYSDHFGIHNVDATIPPVPTVGMVNGAQLFDTTTSMDIPDISSEFDFPTHSSFSYEYWIRTSSFNTMVCLGRHRLDSEGTAFMYTGTDKEGTGKAAIELRDNAGTLDILKGRKVIADGQWHHIIAVTDGEAGTNKIYVDGTEDAGDSVRFDSSFAAEVPTEINIGYLHRLKVEEPHYRFTGALDEIAIYNRAVSASEALTYYNNGHPAGHCGSQNFAPAITSEPVTLAYANQVYSYTFIADDFDSGDTLALSAGIKPSWLSFNWVSGQRAAILQGTPSKTDAGANPVVLRVSDGHIIRDQSFIITVRDTGNSSPVISSYPIVSATVGNPYTYLFTASDADDTSLTKSAILLPDWLQFNPADGLLSGIPLSANVGENEVILRVSDGKVNVDQDFIVVVGSPDGLNEMESAGIHMFPVPAKNDLNFTFEKPFKETHLKIINSLGNIVAIKVLPAYTEKYVLDLGGLENGNYFLEMIIDAKTVTASFIIIK